jgi:hypothetical protein
VVEAAGQMGHVTRQTTVICYNLHAFAGEVWQYNTNRLSGNKGVRSLERWMFTSRS